MKTTILALCLFAAGCGPLDANPGDDFTVTLLTPGTLTLTQAIAPVPMDFAVNGCTSFTLAAMHANTGGSSSHPLTFQSLSDGGYETSVPVGWLEEDSGYCSYSQSQPDTINDFELAVTCSADGRVATTQSQFVVEYAPAPVSYDDTRGSVADLFPGSTLTEPLALTGQWLDQLGGTFEAFAATGYETPLLATVGGNEMLWAGCPLADCGDVQLSGPGGGDFPASYLYVLPGATGAPGLPNPNPSVVAVPDSVTALAADTDQNVYLLERTTGTVQVTEISSAGDWQSASQIANIEGYVSPSQIASAAGGLTFLAPSLTDASTAGVFTISAGAVGMQPLPLPGSGPEQLLSISPDGQAYVAVRGGQVYLGGAGLAWQLLSTNLAPIPTPGANPVSQPSGDIVVWMDDLVAIWSGNPATVDVFSRAAPFARVYEDVPQALPGADVVIGLSSVSALKDFLVETTSTGVRILDAGGNLVAGSDPFPCELTPTAPAVPVGATTVAAAGGQYVYVFDLSQLQ